MSADSQVPCDVRQALMRHLDEGKLDSLEEHLFLTGYDYYAHYLFKKRTGHSVLAVHRPDIDEWVEPANGAGGNDE